MNVIDIIAIIPYFITLGTVVAEEEDTLNLPKAPVSPQVSGWSTNWTEHSAQIAIIIIITIIIIIIFIICFKFIIIDDH